MCKQKRFVRLKPKIIASTLVPVILSFALISAVILASLLSLLHETAESKFLQISERYAHSFETKIASAMNYLSILASDLEMELETGPRDRGTLQRTILRIFNDYGLIDGSSVYFEANQYDGKDAEYRNTDYGTPLSGRICWYFYRDGGRTAYLPEGLGNDIEFELPHYTMAKEANAPIYTDPVSYEIDGKEIHMFTLTYPVRDGGGAFIGAATVDLFLDDIYAQLQSERIYETGYITIANDNGRIVYSPRYDDIGKTREEAGLDYPLSHDEGNAAFFHAKSILNGRDALMTTDSIYIPNLDRHFHISIAAPLSEINAEGTRLMALLAGFGLFITAAIALLLYYLIGKISAPLEEITQSADKIAGGDYHARIKGAYKGEFAVVKDSVNTMADSIEAYMITLDRRLEQQVLMSSVSQSFLSDADADALITGALRRIGEFIGVAQILFYKLDGDSATLRCQSEWINPDLGLSSRIGDSMVLSGPLLAIMLGEPDGPICLNSNNPTLKAAMAPYRKNFQSYITASVLVKGGIFGVLDFSRHDDGREWSESDIHLATLVASLLSGIFERQSMEGQLRRLSSIVESSPQFIMYVTAGGGVNYVNPAAEKISGRAATQLIAGGLDLIFDRRTVREIKEKYIPSTLRIGTENFEAELVCADGRRRIMAFSCFLTGEGNDNVGCIAKDVTEMRKLESDLIAAKELAEQGSQSKSEFLSRMSHEMRTPMNAIIGMTSIAQSSDDPEKKEYCLAKIDNASRHLLGVINDILDMSKIEANKLELSYSEFSFEQMLQNVVGVVHFRVEEKRQALSICLGESVPAWIVGDEQRLAQVITNLLTNAVKFTPERGSIQLRADVLSEEDGRVTIRIEVIDSGIGISAEQQAKLFRSFEQADGSIARKYGGTGLGLAISKRIVELMGGRIWVESDLGEGSNFAFTFVALRGQIGDAAEIEALRPGPDAEPAAQSFAGKAALLAEDVEINREIILTVLEDTGLCIECAEDGRQAVEMFSADPGKYDIILMDIHMPEVDGLEATRQIRALGAPEGVRVPIVAMTASVFQEDVTKCLAAGMNDHIGKPIDFGELLTKLRKYLG